MFRIFFHIFISAIVLILLIVYLPPNYYLLDVDPPSFKFGLPDNSKNIPVLKDATIEFKNQVVSAESMASTPNGDIYMGAENGKFLRLRDGKITNLGTVGKRGIGIVANSRGILYQVDHEEGIYRIIPGENSVNAKLILSKSATALNGRTESKFIEDIAVYTKKESLRQAKEMKDFKEEKAEEKKPGNQKTSESKEKVEVDPTKGDVLYFTSMSQKFSLMQAAFLFLGGDCTGAIFRYDIDENKISLVVADVCGPTGIAITDDGKSLLYSELFKQQVTKLDITESGEPKGKPRRLVALAGGPDNLRRSRSEKETYWVAIFNNATDSDLLNDKIMAIPIVKKLILRCLHLTSLFAAWVGDVFSYQPLKDFSESIITFDLSENNEFAKIPSLAFEFDVKGNVIQGFTQPNGHTQLGSFAQIEEAKSDDKSTKTYYFSSYMTNYLGKLVINN